MLFLVIEYAMGVYLIPVVFLWNSQQNPWKDFLRSLSKSKTLLNGHYSELKKKRLTTLNTAQVAIKAFDKKNIAIRIARLAAIICPGPLLPTSDDSDICE